MIRIAIVDDEESAISELRVLIDKFFESEKIEYFVDSYKSSIDFIEEYRPCDIVFMDIEMPEYNGMKTAEKLRKIDKNVILVFVTNFTKYAMKGYSVNAMDYLLKPIRSSRFFALMKKIMIELQKGTAGTILLGNKDEKKVVKLDAIMYVSIREHLVTYYLVEEKIEEWGSLKKIEKLFPEEIFVRCDYNCIVNLKYIALINKGSLILRNNTELRISGRRRKKLEEKLIEYMKNLWMDS